MKFKLVEKITRKAHHFLKMLNGSYRELYRLRNLPRRTPTQTSLYAAAIGVKGKVEIIDSCTYLEGYNEIFKDEIYKFQANSHTPLIIDCGANIGLSVLYFKKLYPHARIIAFEADPTIYKTLCKNIESTNFQHVDLRNEAIWISNSEIQFTQEGGFSGRISKPEDEKYEFSKAISVRTTRLRDLILRESVIDFLKLDVEGAEAKIIIDCSDILSQISLIFIEYHSHYKEKQQLHTLLEILESQGFRYHIHEAYSVPHPFTDLGKTTMLGMDLQVNIFAYSNDNP